MSIQLLQRSAHAHRTGNAPDSYYLPPNQINNWHTLQIIMFCFGNLLAYGFVAVVLFRNY